MAIGHFAAGVTVTCLLLAVTGWYQARDAPFLLFAGGLWGMLPDTWRFIDPLTRSVHQSVWMNIFAGHQYLDVHLDPTDTISFSAKLVGVMCLAILLVYGLRIAAARRTSSKNQSTTLVPRED